MHFLDLAVCRSLSFACFASVHWRKERHWATMLHSYLPVTSGEQGLRLAVVISGIHGPKF